MFQMCFSVNIEPKMYQTL